MSSRIKPSKADKPSSEASTAPKTVTTSPATPVAPAPQPAQDASVSRSQGLKIILDNPDNTHVIRQFVFTTILMFTVPFIAFFAFKYLDYAGLPIIHLYVRDRNLVGGIGAIAAVQLIMGFFLYKALTEKDEREETPKLKKE